MQSVPMYLSEIAPPKLRGALNFMFQLATTSGILIAQLVNYGTPSAWCAAANDWGRTDLSFELAMRTRSGNPHEYGIISFWLDSSGPCHL